MEETSYPIFLNQKIPWVTKTFQCLFVVCLFILIVFGFYMLPSDHAGDEMKAAYFVLTTSEFEKMLFVIGLVGTPTFFLFYRYVRYKQKGLLTLYPDKIEVNNYKVVKCYPVNEITHMAFNDALTHDGLPKGKLTIDFMGRDENFVSITLANYSQSEQLMEILLSYENIKFDVTNFASNPEILDS